MIWTIVLSISTVAGLWLVPRAWWGWIVYNVNTLVWMLSTWVAGDTAGFWVCTVIYLPFGLLAIRTAHRKEKRAG